MSVIAERAELAEFLLAVAAETGDPSAAVCLLLVDWKNVSMDQLLTARWDERDRVLVLHLGVSGEGLPIEVSANGPEVIDGQLVKFGVRKTVRGTWALEPSLHVPRAIHGFVVMSGVPDPAPWERLIVLATSY
jgi:hypothetical protein